MFYNNLVILYKNITSNISFAIFLCCFGRDCSTWSSPCSDYSKQFKLVDIVVFDHNILFFSLRLERLELHTATDEALVQILKVFGGIVASM